jgi:hypothetical protein
VKGFREAATDARAASGDENSVVGQLHKCCSSFEVVWGVMDESYQAQLRLSTETKLRLGKLGAASSMPLLSSGNKTAINNRDRGVSAYDRWLRSFVHRMGCLKFEILCYSLRILIRVDIDNLEPTHLEDVYAMIPVRRPVEEGVFLRTIA